MEVLNNNSSQFRLVSPEIFTNSKSKVESDDMDNEIISTICSALKIIQPESTQLQQKSENDCLILNWDEFISPKIRLKYSFINCS